MYPSSCTQWAFIFSCSVISVDSCMLFAVWDYFPLTMLGTAFIVRRHFLSFPFHKFIFKSLKATWFFFKDKSVFLRQTYYYPQMFTGTITYSLVLLLFVCFLCLSLQKFRLGSSHALSPGSKGGATLVLTHVLQWKERVSYQSLCSCVHFTSGFILWNVLSPQRYSTRLMIYLEDFWNTKGRPEIIFEMAGTLDY